MIVTGPVGGGGIVGTREPCTGRTYPRSTNTVGPPSTANGTSTSNAGSPSTTRSRASTCASGRYRPVAVTRRHCSSGADESCCGRMVVSGTGSAVSECEIWEFSRDVLVFLPSCHGASTVKHRYAKRDHHDEQGQPCRPQQEGLAEDFASSLRSSPA